VNHYPRLSLLAQAVVSSHNSPPGTREIGTTVGLMSTSSSRHKVSKVAYRTPLGRMIHGELEQVISESTVRKLKGAVNLIFTSPPFPLTRRKKYGNKVGQEYVDWLGRLAPLLGDLLAPDGSIVIEIGNVWNPGEPTMSTLPLEALMAFKQAGQFELCQQFVCNNPSRLPGPAQWVNVERVRVKDSYTHLWWLSGTSRPFADNRRVLQPYKDGMKSLLRRKTYNHGQRPSGHQIGSQSFLQDNGGAIPSNMLEYANTNNSAEYLEYCANLGITSHPARMAPGLAEFFIQFLTRERDLVLDPFAGSNTTGCVAESLGRRWVSIEANEEYIEGSKGRFEAWR